MSLPHNRLLIGIAAVLVSTTWLAAEDAPATRPALTELDREIQQVYAEAQNGFFHVQLPSPRWANDYALEPINKYQQLDPAVRRRIAEQQQKAQASPGQTFARVDPDGSYVFSSRSSVYSNVASRPEQPPASTTAPAGGKLILVRPGPDPAADPSPDVSSPGGQLDANFHSPPDFNPTQMGLVLDDSGHVLVPLYVERETCVDQPVRLAGADGQVVTAKFIGSDRPTNLSVVEVKIPPRQPLPLGERPREGSVCLFLSPVDGSGRLGLWTGGPREFGFVITPGGRVAGLSRYGQFLSGSACRVIADQILKFGTVHRPTLGVIVREVRQQDSRPGSKTLMRVDAVLSGSVADKAGIRPADLILTLDGQPANDVPSLAAAMAGKSGISELRVRRGAESLTLQVDFK